MHLFHFLSHLIDAAVGNPAVLALTITLGAIFFEDLTTVVVAVLAADGIIGVPLALGSLYAGVIGGDVSFYVLGWLASTHRVLARYVDHDFIAPFRAWLETRFVLAVFSARFIPGTRFATYTASGFFRSPFATFLGTAIAATLVWITFLFSTAYWFGGLTAGWLGPVRWSIAGVFLLVLFFIGRHNVLAFRAKQNEPQAP
ncbi:MAG: DedA family protein [Minisyncoccota bacterium]